MLCYFFLSSVMLQFKIQLINKERKREINNNKPQSNGVNIRECIYPCLMVNCHAYVCKLKFE